MQNSVIAGGFLSVAEEICLFFRKGSVLVTGKELRRLSRAQLLELLIEQRQENDRLRAELKWANAALEERKIAIESSGSIAEAALKLSGIFEAADRAVRQYKENVLPKSSAVESILQQTLSGAPAAGDESGNAKTDGGDRQ